MDVQQPAQMTITSAAYTMRTEVTAQAWEKTYTPRCADIIIEHRLNDIGAKVWRVSNICVLSWQRIQSDNADDQESKHVNTPCSSPTQNVSWRSNSCNSAR